MKAARHYLRKLRLRWDTARLAGPAVLRKFAQLFPDAYFVQVGANDGQMMDPLQQQVMSGRWRGIVIEPVPDLFEKLQQHYAAAASRVRPVNLAVATAAGRLPFFHLRAQPGMPSLPVWAAGLGSFRKEVILKHVDRIPQINQYLTEIQVPSLSWDEFCRTYGVTRVDLLVMDTEGYDFEIIRQIDFQRWKPKLLVYEHHHFTPQMRADCNALLMTQGYRQFQEGLDTWCVHPDGGPELIAEMKRGLRRSRFATEVVA